MLTLELSYLRNPSGIRRYPHCYPIQITGVAGAALLEPDGPEICDILSALSWWWVCKDSNLGPAD
jgi:hypothetical protein